MTSRSSSGPGPRAVPVPAGPSPLRAPVQVRGAAAGQPLAVSGSNFRRNFRVVTASSAAAAAAYRHGRSTTVVLRCRVVPSRTFKGAGRTWNSAAAGPGQPVTPSQSGSGFAAKLLSDGQPGRPAGRPTVTVGRPLRQCHSDGPVPVPALAAARGPGVASWPGNVTGPAAKRRRPAALAEPCQPGPSGSDSGGPAAATRTAVGFKFTLSDSRSVLACPH